MLKQSIIKQPTATTEMPSVHLLLLLLLRTCTAVLRPCSPRKNCAKASSSLRTSALVNPRTCMGSARQAGHDVHLLHVPNVALRAHEHDLRPCNKLVGPNPANSGNQHEHRFFRFLCLLRQWAYNWQIQKPVAVATACVPVPAAALVGYCHDSLTTVLLASSRIERLSDAAGLSDKRS